MYEYHCYNYGILLTPAVQLYMHENDCSWLGIWSIMDKNASHETYELYMHEDRCL